MLIPLYGLVALDWDHVDLESDPPELFLPGGLQKGAKRDAYLDLEPETARQLRRYRTGAWKTTDAVFPSRQSNRMSKTSVRRLVKKAATAAGVRPSVAGAGRRPKRHIAAYVLLFDHLPHESSRGQAPQR